ncbi:MAG: hypothetical protein ACYCZF_10655 [Anaerolineae bacterium]
MGGTEQTPQKLEVDTYWLHPSGGWTLWNTVPWSIRVQVTMPLGLAPERWKFIMWVGIGPDDYLWVDERTFTIDPNGYVITDFQLVDTKYWPQ